MDLEKALVLCWSLFLPDSNVLMMLVNLPKGLRERAPKGEAASDSSTIFLLCAGLETWPFFIIREKEGGVYGNCEVGGFQQEVGVFGQRRGMLMETRQA